ncbi:MAG: polysaccharide deacetylase family protein [Candidatus Omnitrophota bacterium]
MKYRINTRKEVPILLYHGIGLPDPNQDNLPLEEFRREMRYLAENGFHPIRLDDLLDHVEGKVELPPRPIILTFDDGQKTVYTNAFSVLKEHGFTATVFLVSDFVGKGTKWFSTSVYQWYDEDPRKHTTLEDIYQMDFLSWEEVLEMRRAGMTFGSHGATHPALSKLSDSESVLAELRRSKEIIETQLKERIHFFAYPWGFWNEPVRKAVADAGYRGACAVHNRPGQPWIRPDDPFAIRRAIVQPNAVCEDFRRLLSPEYWLRRDLRLRLWLWGEKTKLLVPYRAAKRFFLHAAKGIQKEKPASGVCPICHSEKLNMKFKKDSFTIVECSACRIQFASPLPSEDELEHFYTGNYFRGKRGSSQMGYDDYFDDPVVLAEAEKRLEKVQRFRHQGKLLDVGCAAGYFLKAAEKAGWEVQGVEISEEASRYARELLKLDVRTGTLFDVKFPSETFDVVTLWDVLEHIPDPSAFLCEIHRLLRGEGLLVVLTPNIAGLRARLMGRNFIGYRPPEHLYYFSPASLQTLILKTGFAPVSIETEPDSLASDAIAQQTGTKRLYRLVEKLDPAGLFKRIYFKGTGALMRFFKGGILLTLYAQKAELGGEK